MKGRLLYIGMLILCYSTVFAQKNSDSKADIPFYDYETRNLTNTATIPETETKPEQLQITGVVFQSDGVTPAEGVVVYMYQHDENGDYQFEDPEKRTRLVHRAWVITDADGRYTFNTFKPGQAIVPLNYPRHYGPRQFYLVAKTEDSEDFCLPAFMFEDDDLLTKNCKKRLKRKGIDVLLNPVEKDGITVAEKNIILPVPQQIK